MNFVKNSIIKDLYKAYERTFNTIFKSEVDVMSGKAKRILSNYNEREKYLEAIDPLIKETSNEVKVKLEHEEFTLTTE